MSDDRSRPSAPGATEDSRQRLEKKIESDWNEVNVNFENMNLREDLLRGVYACGFEKPLVIQQHAIVPCVQGRDVIVKAQAGAGKTVAVSISILQQIETTKESCQALVLTLYRYYFTHCRFTNYPSKQK